MRAPLLSSSRDNVSHLPGSMSAAAVASKADKPALSSSESLLASAPASVTTPVVSLSAAPGSSRHFKPLSSSARQQLANIVSKIGARENSQQVGVCTACRLYKGVARGGGGGGGTMVCIIPDTSKANVCISLRWFVSSPTHPKRMSICILTYGPRFVERMRICLRGLLAFWSVILASPATLSKVLCVCVSRTC